MGGLEQRGVRFGDFDRTEPVSRSFGGDRGRPLDRYYIEAFLERCAPDVQGHVLEVGESTYTKRFGAERVADAAVIDAPGSGNPNATLLADLASGVDVPAGAFDCIVITQTLHMIYDVDGVVKTLHRALKPGGVVLATVPGISQIDAQDGPEKWFWFMTQSACRRLFEAAFGEGAVAVETHGNVYAATAFLQGLAFEDVDRAKLDVVDPLYPVISTVRAQKAPGRRRAVSGRAR